LKNEKNRSLFICLCVWRDTFLYPRQNGTNTHALSRYTNCWHIQHL